MVDDSNTRELGRGSMSVGQVAELAQPLRAPVRVDSDADLVRAACRGDRAAMGELHRRYARVVHAILLARVPAHDADDLVQDVFVLAISRLDSLREPAAFAGWIATIARTRAIDHRRRARPTSELDEASATTEPRHVSRLHALEVLGAIRALPEAYREVLIMRLVEGMNGPEIAERTGMTPGSVRVNLHRGLSRLKAELGVVEPAEEETEP